MEKVFTYFLAGIAIAFMAPLVGVLLGAFIGWVVGLFFGETILAFLAAAGVSTTGMSMWQVGASMGFLGSFFRTVVQRSSH